MLFVLSLFNVNLKINLTRNLFVISAALLQLEPLLDGKHSQAQIDARFSHEFVRPNMIVIKYTKQK